MYNDLFSIGPFTVHGYGLMIAIGVVVGLFIADKRSPKRGMNGDNVYSVTMWTLLMGFLCAKILFIITYFKSFLAAPMSYIRGDGFVVFGGIIGGIVTIWACCKIKKIRFSDMFDLMIPSVALAQGFGRLGCFLAGCCYGKLTNSAIGIAFSHSDYAPNGIKLIPTQIIMSLGDFAISAFLFWFATRCEKKIMEKSGSDTYPSGTEGRVGLVYLMLYSVGRFFVEFLRNDYRGSVGIFSTSQFIGLMVFAVSAVFYYLRFCKKEKKLQES